MRITCDRCGTEAAAIRAAYEQHGELSATVELRRRFPASRTPKLPRVAAYDQGEAARLSDGCATVPLRPIQFRSELMCPNV